MVAWTTTPPYSVHMIIDPRLLRLRQRLEQRPAARITHPAGAREAAVALVLRPRKELELLLIKRSLHPTDPWSGHMALPGGRRDPVDRSLLETALRETREETSVDIPHAGGLLGALDEVHPQSTRLPSITIAPFVVGVHPDTRAYPDPREVAAALWVPLPALRDPGAVAEILVDLEEGSQAFPAFRYGPHIIWGLTHRILLQFLEVADEPGL
jgi:8-oxo-dGTP pyrophosphatase MutT (NUDIX family)